MPVYEFLCRDCHRVFNFLARTQEATRRRPKCPKCRGGHMKKLFSRFASVSSSGTRSDAGRHGEPGGDEAGDLSPQEEARMERAMMSLANDIDKIDESNPRQLAGLMRRLSDATGEPIDEPTNEMIRRLEAGEDPDKLEEKMADAFGEEGEMPGCAGRPSYDDALHEL